MGKAKQACWRGSGRKDYGVVPCWRDVEESKSRLHGGEGTKPGVKREYLENWMCE